ncbi:hypothetical protein GTY64_03675 [Streptomyces sp. SID8376]|uniref:hypothetical protein n=1 Tax=unclassified Streptomyces TaxID=2593676 RepID=UPI00036719AF|nr:hypothetical protein [Streptomyces sp. SID8376]
MAQQNSSAPESAQINPREPLHGAAALAVRDQLREPSNPNLDIAVHVAREMLAAYGSTDYADPAAVAQAFGATRESLRILLRALGAEPVDEQEAVRRSVDAQFPAVAAFLATERGEGQ